MTETEVERLVVRLVGDGQSYVKMLQDATKSTQDAAKQIEQSTGKIEKMRHSLESLGGTATKVFGAIGIGLSFKAMYDMWDKSDDLITELTTVIKMNGGVVDEVIPKYKAFAKEMAAVTTNSKATVLELAKQAEMLGLTGEKAQRAIKNAITLGAMKNADPTSFMRQSVNFEKTGNASGLARILGLMGEMEEDTTKAAEAAKLLEKNWALVLTKGEDGGAVLQRSIDQIKELGKEAGALIGSVVEPLIKYLADLVKWFQTLDPTVRQVIVGLMLLLAATEPVSIAWTFMTGRIVAVVTSMTTLKAAMIGNIVMQQTWANAIEMTTKRIGAMVAANGPLIVVLLAVAAAYAVVAREQSKLSDAMAEGAKHQAKVEEMSRKRSDALGSKGDHDKNVSGKESALHAARKAFEEADEAAGTKRYMPIFGAGYQADYDVAKKQVEEAEKLYEIAKESRQRFLDSQKQAVVGPSAETVKAVHDLEASIKLQQETMGMSSDQAKIYELRQKAVGDASLQASLDIAEYNMQMLEQAKAQDSAIKSAKEYAKQLQFEIETFGMDEDAARLKKLAMEGVDDETIARIDKLQREKYMLESVAAAEEMVFEAVEKKVEAYRAIDAMRAGSAASRTAVFSYQNRFGDDAKSEQKQTNRLLVDAVNTLQEIRDKDTIQVEEDALA